MPDTNNSPKLMDRLRNELRVRQYAYNTEKTYMHWVLNFILFHDKQHPKDMGPVEIKAFLTHLAVNRNVSASTQNQALCAIVFLYKYVLEKDLGDCAGFTYAKRPARLPVVMTVSEARAVLDRMSGPQQLLARLMYGTGMRVSEALRIRVHDIDFDRHLLTIRDSKGGKDRTVMLPVLLEKPLRAQLDHARKIHAQDLSEGFGAVALPNALRNKYPNAERAWGWQYVFPSWNRSVDPHSGVIRRHHIFPDTIQRAVRKAAKEAGITKHVKCHAFRQALTYYYSWSSSAICIGNSLWFGECVGS